jgi:hypothetical protein
MAINIFMFFSQRRAYGAGSGPSPSGFGYVLSVFLHSFAIPVLNYLQWPVTSQINGQASIPRYVFEAGKMGKIYLNSFIV